MSKFKVLINTFTLIIQIQIIIILLVNPIYLCAGSFIQWEDKGNLIYILFNSGLPHQLSNFSGLTNIDIDKSYCVAHIYKPSYYEGVVTNKSNIIKCKIVYLNHKEGQLTVNLADAPIQSWSNYPNDNSFQIEDNFYALKLWQSMQKIYYDHNKFSYTCDNAKFITRMLAFSPCKTLLIETFYLNKYPPSLKDPYSLSCEHQFKKIEDTEEFVSYKIRCVFFNNAQLGIN